MWYFFITFLLGASIGSFVNVLIDRTILGENWVSGRSHCDNCGKTLSWYDMIPVLSYFLYLGKSRCCKTPLTYRYPVVEIIVGLLFVWWLAVGFWFFRLVVAPLSIIQPGFWLVSGVLLMILALADLFYGVVLIPIVWIGYALTILYRGILLYYGSYQGIDMVNSLVVGALAYLFFWGLYKLTKGRGMAEGDMYVALYIGLILGWPRGLLAIMGSFVLGAVVGVVLIATKIRTRKDTLPFVPFMVMATAVALLWGEQIIRFWY